MRKGFSNTDEIHFGWIRASKKSRKVVLKLITGLWGYLVEHDVLLIFQKSMYHCTKVDV